MSDLTARRMAHAADAGAIHPDSPVVWHDRGFRLGTQGWETLYPEPGQAFNRMKSAPLSLTDTSARGRALLMSTFGGDPGSSGGSYATKCSAIKRDSHRYIGGAHPPIVDFEVWFSVGTENSNGGPQLADGNYGVGGPKRITFSVDSMYPVITETDISPIGKRAFFRIFWDQFYYDSGVNATYRQGRIQACRTVGTYGEPGHISPDSESSAFYTGYRADIFSNRNKRNQQYARLRVNCLTGEYIELQIGHMIFDLTNCPNGTIGTVLDPEDDFYNDQQFNGGLNGFLELEESISHKASWMALHETRMSYVMEAEA
ncbi:hypothetical protein SEA_KIKO_31 [Gordonia phage Kiko]|nr:hypothetical protein SEA_KIKO_31 [Gordonia phage Kiko]